MNIPRKEKSNSYMYRKENTMELNICGKQRELEKINGDQFFDLLHTGKNILIL